MYQVEIHHKIGFSIYIYIYILKLNFFPYTYFKYA